MKYKITRAIIGTKLNKSMPSTSLYLIFISTSSWFSFFKFLRISLIKITEKIETTISKIIIESSREPISRESFVLRKNSKSLSLTYLAVKTAMTLLTKCATMAGIIEPVTSIKLENKSPNKKGAIKFCMSKWNKAKTRPDTTMENFSP